MFHFGVSGPIFECCGVGELHKSNDCLYSCFSELTKNMIVTCILINSTINVLEFLTNLIPNYFKNCFQIDSIPIDCELIIISQFFH